MISMFLISVFFMRIHRPPRLQIKSLLTVLPQHSVVWFVGNGKQLICYILRHPFGAKRPWQPCNCVYNKDCFIINGFVTQTIIPFWHVYLTEGDGFGQVSQCVGAVQDDTVHTHWLLVLLAVKHQRLHVHLTAGHTVRFLDPRGWVPSVGLANVAEGTVRDRLAFREALPAHGTPIPAKLRTALQTVLTETVGTRQHQGVFEDVPTHRTSQLLLERLLRHDSTHTLSHGFVRVSSSWLCFRFWA